MKISGGPDDVCHDDSTWLLELESSRGQKVDNQARLSSNNTLKNSRESTRFVLWTLALGQLYSRVSPSIAGSRTPCDAC